MDLCDSQIEFYEFIEELYCRMLRNPNKYFILLMACDCFARRKRENVNI